MKAPKKDSDDETTYLNSEENFLDIDGVTALVDYLFKDNKLFQVICTAMADDENLLSTSDTIKLIRNKLTELYGDYKKDGTSTYIWETDKSTVSLWSYKSLILVTFEEKSTND